MEGERERAMEEEEMEGECELCLKLDNSAVVGDEEVEERCGWIH